MKKRFFITTLILAMLMIMANVSSVFADKDARESYGYTVKIYAGEQGSFNGSSIGSVSDGGKVITISNVKPGTAITIDESTTGLKLNEDSEYYIRGFKIAGHDNDELVGTVPAVTEDVSYEAAYGLKGNMVKYTIMYLDEDGESILDSSEYYGMVGDKPVVSYKYVEGYQPNAYNLTKTLSANEAENVFSFSYTANGTATPDNGNNANQNNANANNANNANANANANAAANQDGNANAPATIVDLDDNATPLADNADDTNDTADTADIADSETPKAGVSPLVIGAGLVALAAIAAAVLALVKRRNSEDEDDDDDENAVG